MVPNESKLPIRAVLRGAIGMVLVGSSVAVSFQLVTAPLFTAQAVRYLLAAVLLIGLCRVAGVRVLRPRGAEWAWLAGIAATGLVVFNIAVVRGVAHAEPAVIAVAVACAPVVLGVVGPLLERRVPHGRVVAAAVVVTVGSVLVEGAGSSDAIGIAWAAVALGCECGFTLLALPVLRRHGAWGVSVHAVWLGATMFAALGLVIEGPAAITRLTWTDLAVVTFLAVFVTAAAFVLWYSAVATLGSGRAGLLTGIAPVSAALIGIATTGLVPGPWVWVGVAIVVGGLALGLSARPGRRLTPRGRPATAPAAAPVGPAPPG